MPLEVYHQERAPSPRVYVARRPRSRSPSPTIISRIPVRRWSRSRSVSPSSRQIIVVPADTPPERTQPKITSTHLPRVSEEYNFDDWNVAIQVEETLYKVHKFFFKRESSHSAFRSRFDETLKGHTIMLSDVSCLEFDALLQFMYSGMFDSDTMTLEKWLSVLHLSSLWSMHRIKAQAISHINALEGLGSVDKIIIAMKEGIEAWLVPALASLVKHDEFISVAESRKLFALGERQVGPVIGMDIVPLLAQARERFTRSRSRSTTAAEEIMKEVFGYPYSSPVPSVPRNIMVG